MNFVYSWHLALIALSAIPVIFICISICGPFIVKNSIKRFANVSASTASKIKQSIEKEFRKKEPNKFMPAYCIPTKEVIKYFDLDIEFLKSIAYFDKEINDGLPK